MATQAIGNTNGVLFASGDLDALNEAVTISDLRGAGSVSVQLTGTFTATVTFELSNDNSNWVTTLLSNPDGSSPSTTANTTGVYVGVVAGYKLFRVRCSAYTSGTITATVQTGPTVNLPRFATNVSGEIITSPSSGSSTRVQGYDADAAAATGNPVQIGGVDITGDVQAVRVNTDGRIEAFITSASGGTAEIQGSVTDGAAISAAKPVLVSGGDTFGNAQTLLVDTGGSLQVAGYSETAPEAWRNNTQGTLLVSAARTATTASSDQTNYNAQGVILYLNVTVASGTGGLQVTIQIKDPVSGLYRQLNTAPTAVTATGLQTYAFYPGIATTGAYTQANQQVLPRVWRANVVHGDGSSYTYSLGFALIV